MNEAPESMKKKMVIITDAAIVTKVANSTMSHCHGCSNVEGWISGFMPVHSITYSATPVIGLWAAALHVAMLTAGVSYLAKLMHQFTDRVPLVANFTTIDL